MKNTFLLLTAFAFFISCNYRETVRGNGNAITESRTVSSFRGVQLRGSMNVRLIKGADHAVTVEGEENILPYLETYVNDGKLIVKYRDGININTREDLVVNVTVPELDEIEVTGSGDITGENKFLGDEKIKVEVTGSGDVNLELDAPAVEASITGSGDIDLRGSTKHIKCSTTGSGEIDASGLKSENATVRTLGSGSIRVFASVKLDATINGSGDIAYKGGASVSSKIHGSGTVKAID
ncbi:head GIN domain-containing protein [Agriterribacter sp.]|uniref:head GIN domain-containing protein n=1 Tax=Agriterribacter sp. TaxID=2821509 RepID=UPI002CAE67F1|nr:head GIN domain-containing protein [Agriterribacter sp.]HRP55220.1 head GIN domain-containing protein [Agriterribacter sp.]